MTSFRFLFPAILAGIFASQTISSAAVLSFDFRPEDPGPPVVPAGLAGMDLDGLSSGSTSLTVDGITLMLNASVLINGVPNPLSEFNLDDTNGLGINADGSGDATDQFDSALGAEGALFTVTSSVPLSSLTLLSADFQGLGNGGEDTGTLNFAGGSFFTFNDIDGDPNEVGGSDVLTVNELIVEGQEFTIAHLSGGDFRLQGLTFNAVSAVPEPSAIAGLFAMSGGLLGRRRRRS